MATTPYRLGEHIPDHSGGVYQPRCDWAEGLAMQCGSDGVVASSEGTYRCAFFEVFPDDGFVRGEGENLADAEADAWARFVRQRDCRDHRFERRGHRNGGGICARCGKFAMVFDPIEVTDEERAEVDRLVGGLAQHDSTTLVAAWTSALEALDRDEERRQITDRLGYAFAEIHARLWLDERAGWEEHGPSGD